MRDVLQQGIDGDRHIEKSWTLAAVAERYGRPEIVALLKAQSRSPVTFEQPRISAEKIQLIKRPEGKFPRQLIADKVFGDVELELLVDPKGLPHFPVVKQAQDPRLGDVAIQMAKNMVFSEALAKSTGWRRVVVPFGFAEDNATTKLVVTEDETDRPPVLLTTAAEVQDLVKPRPQPAAVWMQFVVTDTGAVASIRIMMTTDPAATEEAAAIARRWHYQPALRNGETIWCRTSAVVVLPDGLPLPAEGFRVHGVVADGTRPPKMTHYELAPYPEKMRSKRLRGLTVVKFKILPSGRVSGAEVVTSSNPAFNAAAIRSVEAWRYEPAKKDGKPVDYDERVSICYDMDS